jgi:gas vesicle protein
MTNIKKSAKKARKQLQNIEMPDVSKFHFDDIEWNVLKRREEEAASKGFLGGFLVGILVGAVISLIFAPRRGDETRDLVASAATDLKDRATDLVHQVKSDAADAADSTTTSSVDGPAIEREIGTARDGVANKVNEVKSKLT